MEQESRGSSAGRGLEVAGAVWSRVRMPLMAVAVVGLVVSPLLPFDLGPIPLVVFVVASTIYFRIGTPRADPIDLDAPVTGRWVAMNSPSSRVPSHGLHAWAQTYAIDLVFDPGDGSRPGMSMWPLVHRPSAFPGFGEPVRAPCDGTVVRSVSFLRDHLSRTSPFALAYLLLESVRELLGPWAVVGNHVVIRRDDGAYVLLAHLRRRSVRVRRGSRVSAGEVIAECGNSGNSTEPHVHMQVMDRKSTWIAAGIPFTTDGADLPKNGRLL